MCFGVNSKDHLVREYGTFENVPDLEKLTNENEVLDITRLEIEKILKRRFLGSFRRREGRGLRRTLDAPAPCKR